MPADEEYDMGPPPLPPDEVKKRRQVLIKAGYTIAMSKMMSECPDIDIHLALDLRAKGCDPHTAVRILT